jgi:glucokinase
MIAQGCPGPAADSGGNDPRVLAVDLGATNLRAAAITASGEALARREAPTPHDGSPLALVGSLVDLLSAVAADLPADARAGLAGIGVSAVGPLDAGRGVLLGPPNLGPGYRGLELAEPLRAHFGLPTAIERDTNVAALAERAYDAARGCDDFIYLTVSTGVGGGIFSQGRLLTGARGFAGELGHVPVAIGGPRCGCGHPGHLEAYVSGTGLARRAREAVATGRSPALAERARERGDGELDAIDVVAAEAVGDPVAAALVAEAIEAFGVAVVGFLNAFDPELIVVGGGVAVGLGGRLLEAANQKVAYALAPPTRSARVVAAALGDDVGLRGCLPLVEERIAAAGRGSGPGIRTEARA